MTFPDSIKRQALEIGFDLVGISPIEACPDLNFSREWVERGYGGEMHYLENPKRDDARRALPSAQSVICVGLVYNADLPYSTEVGRTGSRETKPEGREKISDRMTPTKDNGQRTKDDFPRGWISRYAWGADYHQVMRSKLEKLRAAVESMAAGVETRVYVDTGPIVERAFARLSGIGWMGKNTCLINESRGSWFFLGVILTSLELSPDLPAPDRCGSCTRCIEACPTDALVEPYVMDASRCIAYLNIELKGSIPEQFRAAIGANVVGCDICQDVCPWNGAGRSQESGVRSQLQVSDQPSAISSQRRAAATTKTPEFQPLQVEANIPTTSQPGNAERVSNFDFRVSSFSLYNPPLDALASLSEGDFRRIFRRSPVKRVKYHGWLRNLCVVMGNSADTRFLLRLEDFRQHSDPIIREHAEWAIAHIVKMNPAECA